MNLVLIAALVAVCSAAKLDRTYLPPVSAKTAGGSAGSLQTPFAGNSFNQRPSFPKGSFSNDFQGVVVDAAAPGTRASESETGLGAPRQNYGSTNSKVGDAAFRGNAGFRLGNTQAADEEENLDSDVQAANTQEAGVPHGFGGNGQRFEATPERAQAAYDRVANTLRFENEVGTDGYHYAFETDNGISAEENGVATNGVQAQGGYSYTGDDGQVYSVTYTADEGGYQPRGDHLPTPPPIPVEILKSLEQNARDEAAGLVDDGSYDAQRYNAGADYAESDITNEEQNNRRAPNFGRRPESDATASGSFISQNNQAFVRPNPNELPNQEDESSNVPDSSNNAFGPSSGDNSFNQAPQSNRLPSNRFGSRNEYRPSGQSFKQNGKPQRPNASNNIQENDNQESNSQYQGLQEGQESQPSIPFGGSNRNTFESQGPISNTKPSRNNGRIQPSRNSPSSASGQFSNRFASSNEYLPPVRGQPGRPQRPNYSSADAVPEQNFNQVSESGTQTTGQEQPSTDFAQDFSPQANANVQAPQPINNFQQKPQGFNNRFQQNTNDRFQQNTQPFPAENEETTNDKSPSVPSFESQRPTSLPSTELTTPLGSNEESKEDSKESSESDSPAPANSFNGQNFNARPTSQIGGQPIKKQPARPLANTQPQPSNTNFPTRGQNQYSFQSGNQKQPNQPAQGGLALNQPDDAQFSPSTVRPSYNQQPQGADDSYYYRQPAKPFNTPTNSRFPSTPSGQFNGLAQHSQSQFSENTQQNFPVNSFQPQGGQPNRGSSRYPDPPTLAPAAPTASINGQFGSTTSAQYNGITQASASAFQPQNGQSSTRYPRPPTLAPTAPTTTLGSFSYQNNGITQASASAFTSDVPTAATNSNAPTFGSRPTFQTQYQQNQFQSTPAQTFGQRQPQTGQNVDQDDASQTTPTQQNNGEIYEYSKPAERFPAQAKPETGTGPQRGQPQPQFSQAQGNRNAQELNAQSTRPSFGSRPQFSSQRPQYTKNTAVNSQDQPADDSNAQFNIQSRPTGSQPQRPQTPARPQFGQSSGRPNQCCQSLDAQISKLEAQRPGQANRGSSRPQFAQAESQFSGPVSQGSSQAFAGRGEVFGGPRKPPSFDQETGYHY